MSVQAMTWVFDHSDTTGSDRLVLLALANHADSLGRNAHPSIDLIAYEARVHRSTAARSLARLKEMGAIELEQAGGGRGRVSHYRVVMGEPEKPSQDAMDSETTVSERVADDAAIGRISSRNHRAGATQNRFNRPEPSPPTPPPATAEGTPAIPNGRPPPSASVGEGDGEQRKHRPRADRAPNPLRTAVIGACGLAEPLTLSSGRAVERAVRELERVGATPADVERRAAVYRERWPEAKLTPKALTGHWPALAEALSDRPARAKCPDCGALVGSDGHTFCPMRVGA